MKRFMKFCAITALIFGVLGSVLGAIGSSVAGRTTVNEVVDTVTGGRVHVNLGGPWWNIWNFGLGDSIYREMREEYTTASEDLAEDIWYTTDYGMPDYDTGGIAVFEEGRGILSGDVEKYCPGDGIRRLDIEAGGCRLYTAVSEDDSVYVEAENVRKYQGYVDRGTLYIKANLGSATAWSDVGSGTITLYLPENFSFEEVEVSVGAGSLEFENLYAEEVWLEAGAGYINVMGGLICDLDVSVGAGSVVLTDVEITDLVDIEVGMGECIFKGAIYGDAWVECSMGNVEMTLEGREEDFNYHLEGSMGNIEIGSERLYGFGTEKNVWNNAPKNIEIECAMGNLTIDFSE